ncbi:hypothetical protein [Streptomyces noursei]|uniref:hypothetical protein n=1 Tax=Streptomyces noursei TaxID=1971 RepID=UPI00167881EA|nr:hypothetical protein [Streptomyces noursei]MCZ1019825.1 hypothetical protein [Streptomyces noursei]GGX36382.1 hypothetical protein GCM10010341_67400 [Streptomyces noursei]
MSSDAPVDPAEVPVFTGDLDLLETKVKSLSHGGPKVETAGSDVHKSFGGLSAFYRAPEAEQLFGVTKPVADKAHDVSHDMGVIAGALGTYAREVRPLVHQLQKLKQDAADFRHKVDSSDDDWREDGDLTDENLARRNKIAEVWAAFQAAERDCHAKIVGLVGGKALHAIDASHKTGYGYDAETLKQSKSLPWGEAVEESVPWWKVWRHAYDFGKGVIIDGAWGSIKGLLTLFGWEGSEAAGQAWLGLAKLTTTTSLILAMPGLAAPYLMTPGRMLPSWFRDSRTAMLETGKAFVAWDQWESNGSRAAGAVTFNAITAIITRGGGAAVEGATKAGVAVRAVSMAGKVGEVIDPMTYVFKGAGAGISKIGDVMAHLKNAGHLQVPKISEGAYSLPEGATKLPDGTVQLPKGTAVPEGATRLPDGSIKLPEDTVTFPPNTVKDPSTGKLMDGRGDLYNEDGSLFQRAEDAPKGQTASSATGAEYPRTETQVRQEQRVLATVGGRGDDAIRVGSDVSDPVHAGDNAGHDHAAPGDNTPVARAGDHSAPGGSAGNHVPTNSLDNGAGGAGRTIDTSPTTGGGHTDTPSTSSGSRDLPGSPAADNGLLGGSGHPETPSIGHLDDETTTGNRSNEDHDGAHDGNAGERELTAEERKAIQDEHVRKANEDPVWRKEHYDKLGRRKSVDEVVDGAELPQLAKGPDGKLIAKHDMPNGPSETKFGSKPLGLDTVPDGNLPELNKAAANRKVSVDLTNAAKALEETPSPETKAALSAAQEAYIKQLGDLPNNSKISEALGEQAAALHVIPHEFHGAEVVDLPKTPTGANMFDQVYKIDDGGYLIVEAKAPSGDLDWRHGRADPDPANPHLDDGGAQGMRVKQGTKVYVRTILAEMQKRGGRDAEIAAELRTALREGKLQYVLVKANHPIGSSYAGAKLDYLKIQP